MPQGSGAQHLCSQPGARGCCCGTACRSPHCYIPELLARVQANEGAPLRTSPQDRLKIAIHAGHAWPPRLPAPAGRQSSWQGRAGTRHSNCSTQPACAAAAVPEAIMLELAAPARSGRRAGSSMVHACASISLYRAYAAEEAPPRCHGVLHAPSTSRNSLASLHGSFPRARALAIRAAATGRGAKSKQLQGDRRGGGEGRGVRTAGSDGASLSEAFTVGTTAVSERLLAPVPEGEREPVHEAEPAMLPTPPSKCRSYTHTHPFATLSPRPPAACHCCGRVARLRSCSLRS